MTIHKVTINHSAQSRAFLTRDFIKKHNKLQSLDCHPLHLFLDMYKICPSGFFNIVFAEDDDDDDDDEKNPKKINVTVRTQSPVYTQPNTTQYIHT